MNHPAFRPRTVSRLRVYGLGAITLALLIFASLAIGSRPIALAQMIGAFVSFDPGNDLHLVVWELRLPRTLLGITAGAALGMAGAVMQAVTRNPLAEPGLLGVNSGAAMAVVTGASAFGLTRMAEYVWFGMAGAGVAGAAVFLLGRAHASGTDPVRLILAGAGVSLILGAAANLVILNSGLEVLDVFRNWMSGALSGRDLSVGVTMTLALICGGAVAFAIAPGLNALALGQDTGTALGLKAGRIWALACLSVMILAGAATAAAGPIAFIGLAAPHAARALSGADNRHIIALSGLIAAATLLAADVLGRVVLRPDELAAGIVASILGGLFFIHAVRRFRLARL